MRCFDLISDLHLDMHDQPEQMLLDMEPLSPLLVIAGDLCEARHIQEDWLEIISDKYELTFYVPGNHEFYGSNREKTLDKLRSVMPYNIYLLNGDSELYSDIAFAGHTLWFPDDGRNWQYERAMNDFAFIEGYRSWVYDEHEKAKAWLSKSWCDVWITHHLPLWRSVHPKYEGSPLNRFFVGDISKEIQTAHALPKVIVHGHTHEECDYMAGDVRVVCNPLGYPNEGRRSIMPVKIAL